ncbi:MAG: hypothetical protein IIT90_07895, partial [Clostridiales bacterium]|nr:hypothetical protein [Clostridiales bacterium]
MKFGHFDDLRKEYVINTPRTPYPWINYLGNQGFFSLISNTAGGYSFSRRAAGRCISSPTGATEPLSPGPAAPVRRCRGGRTSISIAACSFRTTRSGRISP